MQTNGAQADCQICYLRHLVEGPQESHRRSLQQVIRSYLGPRRSRAVEGYMNDIMNWYARLRGRNTKPAGPSAHIQSIPLKAGDLVRVRSLHEIEATLNHSRRLKGCSFPPEMEQYCDTTQRVMKPVERFVDERDYRVLRIKGVVLLDGLTCQGIGSIGRCDRNCYFFWREEWLEKIDLRTSF
jgi:hypothetical protein